MNPPTAERILRDRLASEMCNEEHPCGWHRLYARAALNLLLSPAFRSDVHRALAEADAARWRPIDEAIDAWLAELEMTEDQARVRSDVVACACMGSPIVIDGRSGPCYCELWEMKRQQVRGEPVVGWSRP